MMALKLAALTTALHILPALATDWHYLTFYSPNGQKFTSLSGTMLVPTLPSAATYYVWPGLQPTDNSGVYQNVLDGHTGSWWFASGWCCANPSLPWGGGFSAPQGQSVTFSNTLGSDGQTWTSTIAELGSSTPVTNDFNLGDKSMNQAVFAIELDGPTWDFGPLQFANVLISATGTDTSFCNDNPFNFNSATNFEITGANPVVSGDRVDCHISNLVLQSPK